MTYTKKIPVVLTVKDGVLPELKAGNRVLINLDVPIEHLTYPTAEKFRPKAKAPGFGGIRTVATGR